VHSGEMFKFRISALSYGVHSTCKLCELVHEVVDTLLSTQMEHWGYNIPALELEHPSHWSIERSAVAANPGRTQLSSKDSIWGADSHHVSIIVKQENYKHVT
jgi:hypothetical protein